MTDTNPPIPFGAPKPRRNIAIEESLQITQQILDQNEPKPEPTYTSVVAEGIDACRYLDVKAIATAIMGDPVKPIETVADLADRMAEWGAANKTGAR
jgi:hypothetical protein